MAVLGRKPAVTQDARVPIVVTVGLTQPSLYDLVTQDDGTVFEWTGGETVTFSMRPLLSRTPFINSAAAVTLNPPVGPGGSNIRYDWQDGDRSLEGNYMAWWGIELADSTFQETDEFPLLVSDHGPGLGTPTGAVVDGIGQYMPVTFFAMRDDPQFGDRYLQKFADRAKRELMNAVVPVDEEIGYDPQLVDYLSKLAAKHLCLPGKDYWMRQWKTRTTQSPVEISSYPDQIAALDQLHAQLCRELPSDLRQIRFYLGATIPVAKAMPAPASTLDCVPRRTLDPNQMPPPRVGGPHWVVFPFP